jgi:hypothetical protein
MISEYNAPWRWKHEIEILRILEGGNAAGTPPACISYLSFITMMTTE